MRLYRSADLRQWQDAGVLDEAEKEMGYMWECPDFFTLNGKHILMFSPQGLAAKGYQNRNLFQSGYLLGEWQPGQAFVLEGRLWKWITGMILCPAKLPHSRRPPHCHRLAGYVGIAVAGAAGWMGGHAFAAA